MLDDIRTMYMSSLKGMMDVTDDALLKLSNEDMTTVVTELMKDCDRTLDYMSNDLKNELYILNHELDECSIKVYEEIHEDANAFMESVLLLFDEMLETDKYDCSFSYLLEFTQEIAYVLENQDDLESYIKVLLNCLYLYEGNNRFVAKDILEAIADGYDEVNKALDSDDIAVSIDSYSKAVDYYNQIADETKDKNEVLSRITEGLDSILEYKKSLEERMNVLA